jgi:hypothetical protein
MTLHELLGESSIGNEADSLTNVEYDKICNEEINHAIKEILQSYTEALRDASKYYIR